jgi:2-aminomuconate deaminase
MSSEKSLSKKQAIMLTEKAPAPLGTYSHAVKANGFLFVSGQGARDAKTGKEVGVELDKNGNVVSYDIEVQTKAVLNNLATVLLAAGCTMEDLVEVNVFLTDMADFQTYNRVYNEFLSIKEPPARTTVQVAGLPGNNHIEIKAVAVCSM